LRGARSRADLPPAAPVKKIGAHIAPDKARIDFPHDRNLSGSSPRSRARRSASSPPINHRGVVVSALHGYALSHIRLHENSDSLHDY
jgi:hypothetical protein